MLTNLRSANIVKSFKILKGNARVSVISDLIWSIPFNFFHFYLSLYMKNLGITNSQIGILIAIEFVAGSIISFFSSVIVDALGRKKATMIFELICWPGAMFIFFMANSFWLFAVAFFLQSFMRISLVSFNLMIVEDSDNEQRIAAFNLLSIVAILSGVMTPLAGLLVKEFGIIRAERLLLAFTAVLTFATIIIRNHYYTETSVGSKILSRYKKHRFKTIMKDAISKGPYKEALQVLKTEKEIMLIICVFILYNVYVPIGTHTSLYYVPYITEVLRIEASAASILGSINAIIILLVNILIIPIISRYNKLKTLIVGIIMQGLALGIFMVMPPSNFSIVVANIVILSIGFSILKPFIDTVLAEFAEVAARSGIYSLAYTAISISSGLLGLVSGYIYALRPRLLYLLPILILLICIVLLLILKNVNLETIE